MSDETSPILLRTPVSRPDPCLKCAGFDAVALTESHVWQVQTTPCALPLLSFLACGHLQDIFCN